jgi:hypothetical protein
VLKFNPTSRLLVSGSADNTVRLIAIPDGLGDSCTFYPPRHPVLNQAHGLPSFVSVVELRSHDNLCPIFRTIRRCISTLYERRYIIFTLFSAPASV